MKKTIAVALTSVLFPLTILASVLTSLYYKSTNPDNVDISQGLAYLQQSMTVAIVVFMAILIAALVFCYLTYKEEGKKAVKLPLALLITNLFLLVLIVAVNARIGKVQDQYLIDHGRPTLQQFFDNLKNLSK